MARKRSRGGSRQAGRVRYSWHGFYGPTPNSVAITNEVFVLYDPTDADHQEEVVHERTIFDWSMKNNATAGAVECGLGIYLVEFDAAGAMTTDIDPIGNTAFDIESNSTLYSIFHELPAAISGQQTQIREGHIEVKGRRRIEDPKALVMVMRATVVSRAEVVFRARSLVREGRF